MKVTWEKTVIAGETAPGDWIAKVEGQTIGRIFPHVSGWRKNAWEWSFQLGHGEFRKSELHGITDTMQEGADKVKAAFARWIECPEEKGGGKDLPVEYWPHGANRLAWRAKQKQLKGDD